MPIEFRCSQCQKLLRTPDESIGKQARCPLCGTVQPVPNGLDEAAGPFAAAVSVGSSEAVVNNPYAPRDEAVNYPDAVDRAVAIARRRSTSATCFRSPGAFSKTISANACWCFWWRW